MFVHFDQQLQEEKTQKQEALMEKESRLEQLVEQISGLQTEITSLSTFQVSNRFFTCHSCRLQTVPFLEWISSLHTSPSTCSLPLTAVDDSVF